MFHSQLELNSEQFFTMFSLLILPVPNISESCTEIKIKLNVYLTLLCGASKGLMKGLKAFIKPFEAPQRSVKIKI